MPLDDSDSKENKKHRPSKLGRKGDPRMHRSVAARLGNPNLTLLESLRLGGFDFPAGGGDDATVLDADGVTLGQRKNQLSRRLRLAKQQMEESTDDKTSSGKDNTDGVRSSGSRGRRPGTNKLPAAAHSSEMQAVIQAAHSSKNKQMKRSSSTLSISDNEDEERGDAKDADEMAMMAKFHPMFAAKRANLPWTIDAATAAAAQHQVQAQAQAAAAAASSTWAAAASAQLRQNPSQFTSLNPAIANQQMFATANATSGVAIASLKSTASSVGMTLEQLAVALSTSNLAKILQGEKDDAQSKQELALNLFKGESKALHKRCMLMAGYDALETQENRPEYLQFVLKAWQLEGKRLEQMHSTETNRVTAATAAAIAKASASNATEANAKPEGEKASSTHSREAVASDGAHSHSHDHDLSASDETQKECFDGRHIHRLEGKCGHKAIIHQPEDGPAHVDFVIDGKVECYQGIKPAGTNGTLWPSRFNCDQLSCPSDSECNHKVTCGKQECQHECTDVNTSDPKVFELSDIDLDGKEWNTNFFDANSGQIDNTLLGLISLGDNSTADGGKTKTPVAL